MQNYSNPTEDTGSQNHPHDPNLKTWWKDWFNEVYLDVYSHRDEEQADDEVALILDLLPLKQNHRILDFCCGNGRHSRALTRAGYTHVIGMDYSKALLQQGHQINSGTPLVRGDMFSPPFQNQSLDAVVSFFTSFGYFDDERNLKVLHEVARILKPDGWYVLDYLNPKQVIDTLVPESQRQEGRYHITERRSLSADQTRIEKTITIQYNRESREFHESVRLYSYPEMVRMWQSVGLNVLEVLGDFKGNGFREDSPRMILMGKRR
jgi:SAM-dependent methyltransferase